MKDGQIISAKEARSLIATYGVGYTLVNGVPEDDIRAEDIEDGDTFQLVINYGHPAQLHLDSGNFRCEIELEGLRGHVVDGEWVA